MTRLPKLIAFDLDGTIWSPDMYMLWGGGSPFKPVIKNNNVVEELKDCRNQKVKLLGDISSILHELKTNDLYKDIKLAWVSCTDEPEWANECLNLFTTNPSNIRDNNRNDDDINNNNNNNSDDDDNDVKEKKNQPIILSKLNAKSHIYKNNKQKHFNNIYNEFNTIIKYEDMLFFDNELHNINNVQKLGVKSYYCPNGITYNDFQQALNLFL